MNPLGWTSQNEIDYQSCIATLKAQIGTGNDSEGLILAEYTMLTDQNYGREMYLKAKRNGWL